MKNDELARLEGFIRDHIGGAHLNARVVWSEVESSIALVQDDEGSLDPRAIRAREALVEALRELASIL